MHEYLERLLSIKRPSGGIGVEKALQLIGDVIGAAGEEWFRDEHDNIICTTTPTGTLFSCHTDTMHRTEGRNRINVDDFGIVTAWTTERHQAKVKPGMGFKSERDVLGADDGAGIYIMLRMIEEHIPGTYVFHANEEIGCVGSNAIAANPDYPINGYHLGDFTHAIAFDRRGTSDFITNQLGTEMCSAEFRYELTSRLNINTALSYKPAIGLVTDTAMYADFIPECINMSVGYYDEHTCDERLDLIHLETLLGVILDRQGMFENLPAARELPDYSNDTEDNYWDHQETIEGLCRCYPAAVADMLKAEGYDYHELFELLNRMDVI